MLDRDLLDVIAAIARGDRLDAVLDRICRLCEDALAPAQRMVAVMLHEAPAGVLRPAAAPSLPPDYLAAVGVVPVGPRSGSCGTAAFERRPVIVADVASDPLWSGFSELASSHGLRSCWSHPVISSSSGVLATFAVYGREPAAPSPAESGLVASAAALVAIAIERSLADADAAAHRLLAESATDIIARTDSESGILYISPAIRSILGYEPASLLGRKGFDFIPSEDMPAVSAFMREVLAGGAPRVEYRARRADGSIAWLEATGRRIPGPAGSPRTEVVIVARDVTARRDVADRLAASEALNRLVAEAASDGIITVDEGGTVLFANPAAGRIFGRAPEAIVGAALSSLVPSAHRAAHDAGFRRYVGTGERRMRWRGIEAAVLRGDGTELPVEITLGEARSGGRRVFTAVLRDVAERRRLEAQLLHARKMESIGTLAGGIAHELNNLLQPVLTFSRFAAEDAAARDHPAGDPELAEHLALVVDGARKAGEIVARILDFADPKPRPRRPEPFAAHLKAAVAFATRMLPPTVVVRASIPDDPTLAWATATEVMQVVANLFSNAARAMNGRGAVWVTLAPAAAGQGLRLTVHDDGCGMDAATLERAFDPFFTRQGPGGGTGLGLSVVHGLVAGWGGRIAAESAPGSGTAFVIELPPADAPPAAT